jgi:hypothetical protein
MNARPASLRLLGSLTLVLVSGGLFGQEIPVRNWEVAVDELGKRGLFSGLPAPFTSFRTPCRLYDSRVSSGGPGPIPGSGTRVFNFFPGGSPACGPLPYEGVSALSVYITVVGPLGPGFIYAFPTAFPPATPTSIINYNGTPGELRNNAAILAVDGFYSLTIGTGGAGTDIIIDINGIFHLILEDHAFILDGNVPNSMLAGYNRNVGPNTSGVTGFVGANAGAGSAGVIGTALVASGNPNPVYGGAFQSNGTATESAAVLGNSDAFSGIVFGVFADNDSSSSRAAGVFGRIGDNVLPASTGTYGVAGSSYNSGHTRNIGVAGYAQGATEAWGVHGARVGIIQIGGVLGYTGTSGVHSFNDMTAGGTKSFVEPHPTDPSLEIAYVSLEGPEAGTYFRGRGRVQNGLARIPVPESFRLVSEPDGLSIQAMPIGEMATFAVLRIDLNEIVLKASRNVEFFYTVNGVRKGHGDFQAIRKNEYFRPAHAKDEMREWPPETRARLVANGTLTAEGTPHLETAERLGWKAEWEKAAAESKARREEEASKGGIR